MQDNPNLLTIQQLADYLQVHPQTIRAWTRSGKIPCVKISPKIIRYDLEAIKQSISPVE